MPFIELLQGTWDDKESGASNLDGGSMEFER